MCQAQCQVGTQQVLLYELDVAVALGHFVDGTVQIGIGSKLERRQVVGTVVFVVPISGTEAMAGILGVGRLLAGLLDGFKVSSSVCSWATALDIRLNVISNKNIFRCIVVFFTL